MQLFGQQLNKQKLRRLVGDIHQIAGAQPFVYTDGRAKGLEAIEIRNGSGLRLVVLPGRGMDIAYAEYKGVPFSYISKAGLNAAEHYDATDFLRSFTAGMLTTCGLTHFGPPCVDNGEQLGLHGRISNIPAYNVCISEEWIDDDRFCITVSGKVRQSSALGENLVLTREIKVYLGEDRVHLHDRVENEGYQASPFMMLYHFNFGYPLISKDTIFETNGYDLWAENEASKAGLDSTTVFDEPTPDVQEQVLFRKAPKQATARLCNKATGLAMSMTFCGEELPYLTEWKMMGEQDYVVGVEPGTYIPVGRKTARERGELQMIAPQEVREHHITIALESV